MCVFVFYMCRKLCGYLQHHVSVREVLLMKNGATTDNCISAHVFCDEHVWLERHVLHVPPMAEM